VDRWGEAFLTGSTMDGRFLLPVYDGEVVTVRLDEAGELTVTGPDGVVRATGRAALATDLPEPEQLEAAERPDPVPPATRDALAVGTTLGTLRFTYREDLAAIYLGEIRDDSSMYATGALCHPGFLARQANGVLFRNVVLGPWIHVSTRATHRGFVRSGDEIEVRGRVADEYERKGHRFVDLDVEVTANGSSVWSAFHTAIWRPRSSAG
jgi:hypothetical protein